MGTTLSLTGGRASAALTLLLAFSMPVSALAVQEIVETSKDAEIRQNQTGGNFGGQAANDVRSQRSAAALQNRRGLYGFDFTDGEFAGCTVASATFELFLEGTNASRTYDVHPLSGNWAENTVTWTTAAGLTAGALASSANVTDGTEPLAVSWTGLSTQVQAAIDNSAVLTLRVKDRTEQSTTGGGPNLNAQFTSREGALDAGAPQGSFIPRLVLDIDCDVDVCENWTGETAWADGSRYVDRGNWATYTEYAADTTVALYAGQTLVAGTVHFSSPVDGYVLVTISLNPGYYFADVPENVKVENYGIAPVGNPSPGGFSHKDYADPGASSFEIVVPLNAYYGVHVDLERCADGDPDSF